MPIMNLFSAQISINCDTCIIMLLLHCIIIHPGVSTPPSSIRAPNPFSKTEDLISFRAYGFWTLKMPHFYKKKTQTR